MSPKSARLLNFALIGLVAFAFLIFLRLAYLQSAYEKRFDESRLQGLTKDQVELTIGKPEFIIDNDLWMYQSGMEPDAFLTFKNDKLLILEKVKYR